MHFCIGCKDGGRDCGNVVFYKYSGIYVNKKKNCRSENSFYSIAIISMYINAGLIPWYLTMRSIGLKDNFLVYILPTAVSGLQYDSD